MLLRYYPRLEQPKATGFITSDDLDTTLHSGLAHFVAVFSGVTEMQDALDRFFSAKMNLTPFKLMVPDDFQQETEVRHLSWNTYAQSLFIGADYTDYLFPRSHINGKPHQKTVSLYLGIGSAEVLSKLEEERNTAREEYRFETKRLTHDVQNVRERIENLEIEIQTITERIQTIDEGQSVLVDSQYIDTVREHVAYYTLLVAEQAGLLQTLLIDERELQVNLDEAQRQRQELREKIQFKLFFSGLTVERCPNCEQNISLDSVKAEKEQKHCRLCHSELHPVSSIDAYETLLQETEDKIKQIKRAIQEVKKSIREGSKVSKEYEDERIRWQGELRDLPRQERAGFTQEMRNLLDRRGFLTGQLQQLQEQTEENHTQRLQELENTQDILEQAYIEMQGLVWSHYARHWNVLQERTTKLAKLFGIKDIEHVSFELPQRFDLVVRQGGKLIRFQDMEISEKVRLKLALHIAVLIMRTTDGIGRHPGLLIIDAPGSAEMDEHHFQSILQGFVTVKEQLGDQVQVLIASTREAMMSIADAGRFEQYESGASIF
jgi:hypothetical protein